MTRMERATATSALSLPRRLTRRRYRSPRKVSVLPAAAAASPGTPFEVRVAFAEDRGARPSSSRSSAMESNTSGCTSGTTLKPQSIFLKIHICSDLVGAVGSNLRPLACKDCEHHSPALAYLPSAQARASGGEHERAGDRTAERLALPFALPPGDQPRLQ